jgi:acetoin utilization deacetylase AcuC-like enzyme
MSTAIYSDPHCLDHYAPGHPESPNRVKAALSALQKDADLYAWPAVEPADLADIATVHDERQLRRIEGLAASGGGWVDPDTFVTPTSLLAAQYAVGAGLQATRDVLERRVDNAFVVVRPPGHHATSERSMGFCLFNTVAIATEWAMTQGGASRVAIVDIDVHHGNGTQEIFYDRPDVLYYSSHQFPFYPGSGRVEERGANDGVGATINLPLMAGCGDQTYLASTESLLVPALRRFRPDMVLVSLGFDAHWADPLAQLRLSLGGYAGILDALRSLADDICGGKLLLLLEGGYDLQVIEAGASMAGRILAGEPVERDSLGPGPRAPEPSRAGALLEIVCLANELSPPDVKSIM